MGVALPCSYSHCLPPARRALLQPASRALLPCPAHAALPCNLHLAALQPVHRAALPLGPRTALPCSSRVAPPCPAAQRVAPCCLAQRTPQCPARCALLQPARRALLPYASRPATTRSSCSAAPRIVLRQRFRDRWNLVMHVKTKVGQRLSAGEWARHSLDLARVINADQTPLFVEMSAEKTIEHRGARSVPIRTVGYEKTRLTVMLACTASGEKLRPWVWFKLKNVPNCEIPEGIVVQAHDNGWMDESAVQTWQTKEVLPHLNPQCGQNARRAMLVLDSYRGHTTQTMLQAYRTHIITLAVIPAGFTSHIQPLDVSIKRCFKDVVRARYARWFMREGINLKTKKGE
ncbi:unnamed protein product [Closterium sp. NIES-53]